MLDLVILAIAMHSWIAFGLMVLFFYQVAVERGLGPTAPMHALIIAIFWPAFALYFAALIIERRAREKKSGVSGEKPRAPRGGYQPKGPGLDINNPPGKDVH